jgi:hypothetical protein
MTHGNGSSGVPFSMKYIVDLPPGLWNGNPMEAALGPTPLQLQAPRNWGGPSCGVQFNQKSNIAFWGQVQVQDVGAVQP